MLQNIFADLRLYTHLLSTQIRSQAQYKLNMAIDIGTYFAVTSLEFGAMLLYFGPFPSMFGWKVGEVALLYSIMCISFGIAEMFGAGIDLFPDTIRLGEFDRILLRPASSFLLVVGSDFRLRRLGRISQGIIAMFVTLRLLPDLHWTLAKDSRRNNMTTFALCVRASLVTLLEWGPLAETDLWQACLKDTDLRGADLRGANLKGVTGITVETLKKQAKSLKGATMPDGSKHL